MAKLSEIAEDIHKHCGALVSISGFANYAKMDNKTVRELIRGLDTYGRGTGKRYFYKDIAQRLGGIKNV
jgi:hypothetical protein